MSKILIICSDYMFSSDANGVCVKNLVNELNKRGHSILVISESSKSQKLGEKNNVTIYGVAKPWFKRICEKYENTSGLKKICFSLIRGFRGIFASVIYPNVSPVRARRIKKLAERILKTEKIDMVVGIYRPYESIDAVINLSKKNIKKTVFCTCHYDLIISPNSKSELVRSYKYRRGLDSLKKEYKYVDHLLIPVSAKELYPDSLKVDYFDFPLYTNTVSIDTSGFKYDSSVVNIAYIGTIDGKNRRISVIKNIIEEYNKNSEKKLVLHIWGNIADNHTLREIESCSDIYFHGLVENKFSSDLLKRADYCLNLSNAITYNMVPSKIFQLFSVKKPIINIYENEKDKALPYFRKNNYTINIDSNKSLEDNVNALKEWMNTDVNRFEWDDSLYEKSKPEYTVNLLENYLGGDSNDINYEE